MDTLNTHLDTNQANQVLNEAYLNEQSVFELSPWFEQKTEVFEHTFKQQLALITKRYEHTKKWVLVIGSDSRVVHQMQIHTELGQKILWVHANKVAVAQANLERTLMKGNCAAVIVCNAKQANLNIARVKTFAEQGKTHCILFNS